MRLKGINAEFINKKRNSYTVPVALGLQVVKPTAIQF